MNTKNFVLTIAVLVSPYVASNYFVFVFLIPLLYLLYSNQRIRNSRLILYSIVPSSIALLPAITYNLIVYILSVILASIFGISFLLVTKAIIKRFKNAVMSISAPCFVWTGLFYLLNAKSLMACAFDIGVLFPTSAPLIWYVGSIGLTTLIVLFNSAVARYLVKRDVFSAFVGIALLLLFTASFIFSLNQNTLNIRSSHIPEKIALIQGDAPQRSISGYKENLDERVKRYIGLSEMAARENPELIAWPEFALPVDLMNRFPEKMKPIIDMIENSKTVFIIGSLITDKENHKLNYDAALIFNKRGKVEDIYYSQNPVIFNKNIQPKETGNKLYLTNAGITVCWEEVNEKIFRNYVKLGAEYFISISSNADLDYSWFKKYASFFTRARAAENMRYIARATQTGITEIINPFGNLEKIIPANKPAFLAGDIYRITRRTFYSECGDIIAKLFILSLVIISLVSEVIQKRVMRHE